MNSVDMVFRYISIFWSIFCLSLIGCENGSSNPTEPTQPVSNRDLGAHTIVDMTLAATSNPPPFKLQPYALKARTLSR